MSYAKCNEHILVHDDGLNIVCVKNSVHAFRLHVDLLTFQMNGKKLVGGFVGFLAVTITTVNCTVYVQRVVFPQSGNQCCPL